MEKMAHFFPFKTSKIGWLNRYSLAITFILLIAAFLRLYRIGDYLTFLGDEGRDVLVVYDIIQGFGYLLSGNFSAATDKLTLLGPTSSVGGFFLGPIYYYFMAPFLWLFNYDPVGPAVMVGLIGVATVFLIYTVGSEIFNKNAGLIAALLYAISPLVIAYSRSSWQPNPLPFFSLLTLYVLYKGYIKNNLKLFFISGVLLGIILQLHYLGTFLAVIIALYILVIEYVNLRIFEKIARSIITKYFLIFGGFIIGWAPFLAFEFRHDFLNIRSILKFIFASKDVGTEGGNYFEIVSNVTFRLFARLITKYPPPEQVSIEAHGDIAVWYFLTIIMIIVTLAVFVYQYRSVIKEKSSKYYSWTLLLIWFVVGIFLFGFYKKNIYDYYFQFMFSLPFLLVGNAFSFFFNKRLVFKMAAFISLGALVWINYTGIPFWFSPNRQKDQVKHISEFVLSKTDNNPYNFALLTLGNSDHGYRYFFRLAGRDPVVILNPSLDPERKTVTDQLLVVCESGECHPLGASVWEIAGFGRAEIVDKWDVSVVKVYKLKHYTGNTN